MPGPGSSSDHSRDSVFAGFVNGREVDSVAAAVLAGRSTGSRPLIVSGLAGSAKCLFLAAVQRRTNRQILLVTRTNREIEDLQPDLEFFTDALNPHPARQSASQPVLAIPSSESDPYDGTSPHAEVLEERALALYRASVASESGARPRFVVASIRALAQRTVSPAVLKGAGLTLAPGDEMPLELVVDLLISSGYVRQEPVGAVGEFSLRGGILDVFSPAAESPHRIEFFGDSVESIREFDPDTQRSTARQPVSVIAPMREASIRREDFMKWADAARTRWADERFRRDLALKLAHAERGEPFPGWEYLLPLTRSSSSSILDYFKGSLLVIDEPVDIEKTFRDFHKFVRRRYAQADDSGELALAPSELFLPADEIGRRLGGARIELRLLGRTAAAVDQQFGLESLVLPATPSIRGGSRPGAQTPQENYHESPRGNGHEKQEDWRDENPQVDAHLPSPLGPVDRQAEPERPTLPSDSGQAPELLFLFPPVSDDLPEITIVSQSSRRYRGKIADLAAEVARDAAEGWTTVLVMATPGIAERVKQMLGEFGLETWYSPSVHEALSPPLARAGGHGVASVTAGKLAHGFRLPSAGLSFLVESDVFGEVERGARMAPEPRRRQRSIDAFLSDLGDLKTGDYVVHVDHGIGRFQGLVQMPVAGGAPSGAFNVAEGIGRGTAMREFMLLMYAENSRLYVPVERLDLIQRFSASDGRHVDLDRLGGVGWEKKKARARKAMKDMAEELLKLYAERKLVGGHSFSSDSPWQGEFEDAFEYQLTEDQSTAVGDVKSDMEKAEPMDRLIVGDVGYGKTEVAMRAAFKAVMEGKQVAVLAPTTVLTYQHYETFRRRMAAFPVRVEMLSRFRTAREQKQVAKAVENGSIDVVIGTHRLLSKDIAFKDLGLLVVDEEQRFGVAHKERIKQMRKKVDVIAMSATPIPRTLNMSLAGLRDVSVIETPPRDRLAIQTQVVQFAEPIIRSAIELEMQRGGQAFFVHNRVETITAIAELIGRLVPGARIGVGHGQMGEKELESIMLKFIGHKLDILVSTTIIENGIDIPLANTIIINRADTYGLSQLYQLRGRVGRSSRRAYAYLLIPSEESLTAIARRRLAAIREFSDLGAGFRIAALDLELRGAGNLLGAEQSGHIDAVGFDLYTQMLERAVRELKGDQIQDEISTSVNLGIDIRIPDDYIYDMSQRLRVYKRISSSDGDAELADVHAEIEDRYGPIPATVENLFEYARLRKTASDLGIISIDREADRLSMKFAESARIDPDRLISLVSSGEASFSPSGVMRASIRAEDDAQVFHEVRRLLGILTAQARHNGI